MERATAILLIFLSAFSTACAARRAAIDWQDIRQEQGVLIVSAGAPQTCAAYGVMVVIKPSAEDFSIFGGDPALQPHNYMIESDFEDVHAQVHALELPPGEYDFHLYSAQMRDPRVEKRVVSLAAGEVVYAGEIWLEGSCTDMDAIIRDQWQRDRPVVRLHYPQLPIDDVRTRLFESPFDD